MKRKAARKLAQRKRKEEKLKQQEMLVAESRGFGNEFDSATSSSMYGNNEETSESFEKTFATSSDSDSFEVIFSSQTVKYTCYSLLKYYKLLKKKYDYLF